MTTTPTPGQCQEHGGRDLAACDHQCAHWFVGEAATCRKCGADKPAVAESPARAAIRAMLAKRYRGAIEPTEAMIDAVEAGLAGQS